MLKKIMLISCLALAGLAQAAQRSGVGVHGIVGTDFAGAAVGAGVSWAPSYANLPWGLNVSFLTTSHSKTEKDSTDPYEYTEDISLSVLGVRYEILPGLPKAGESSPFFILGGGLVYVPFSYKYRERSLSPSYATSISYSYSDSAVGYQFVLGGGFAAANGLEMRLELPLLSFSFYSAGASGSVFVPTLTGSVGYRF